MADLHTAVDDDPTFSNDIQNASGDAGTFMSGALPPRGTRDLNLRFKNVTYESFDGINDRVALIHSIPEFRISSRDGKAKIVTFQNTVQFQFDSEQSGDDEHGGALEAVPTGETEVLEITAPKSSASKPKSKKLVQKPALEIQVKESKKKGVSLTEVKKVGSSTKALGKKKTKPAPPLGPEVENDTSSNSGVSDSSSKVYSSKTSMTSIPIVVEDVILQEPSPQKGSKASRRKAKNAKDDTPRQYGIYDPGRGGAVYDSSSSPEPFSAQLKDGNRKGSKTEKKGSNNDEKGDQKGEKKSKKETKASGGSSEGSKKDEDESKSSKSASKSSKTSAAPPNNPYGMQMYPGYGPQPWGQMPQFGGAPWYPNAGPPMPGQMPGQMMPGQTMPPQQNGMPGNDPGGQNPPDRPDTAAPEANPNDFDFSIPPPPDWAPPGSVERFKLIPEEAAKAATVSQIAANPPPVGVPIALDNPDSTTKKASTVTSKSKAGSKVVANSLKAPEKLNGSTKSHHSSKSQDRKVVYLSKNDKFLTLRFNVDELKGLESNGGSNVETVKSPKTNTAPAPSGHSARKSSTRLEAENLATLPDLPVTDLINKTNEVHSGKPASAAVAMKSPSKLKSSKVSAPLEVPRAHGRDRRDYKVIIQDFEISIKDRCGSTPPPSHTKSHRSGSIRPEDSAPQVSSRQHSHVTHQHLSHTSRPRDDHQGYSRTDRGSKPERAPSTIHPWESISQVSTNPAQKEKSTDHGERGSNAPDQGVTPAAPTVVSNYKPPTVESAKSSSIGRGSQASPGEGVHISIHRVRKDSSPSDLRRRMNLDGSGSSHHSLERDRVYLEAPPHRTSSAQLINSREPATSRHSSLSPHRQLSEHSHRSPRAQHNVRPSDVRSHNSERLSSSSHHSGYASHHSSMHSRHSALPRHRLPSPSRHHHNNDADRIIVRVRSRHFYDEDSESERPRRRQERPSRPVREEAGVYQRRYVTGPARNTSISPASSSAYAHSRVETIASEDSETRRRSYRRPGWM